MVVVYDDILEAITFRQMDTASDVDLEKYLRNYFSNHNLYLDRYEMTRMRERYRVFGRKIFSTYETYLSGSYRRTHKWFLIEIAHNSIVDIAPLDRIFERMLNNETIEWDKIYDYYDMIGHEAFGDLSTYLDNHRDKLLTPPYDMI